MAKTAKSPKSSPAPSTPPADAEPVTGLGETLPQIEEKTRTALIALAKHFRKDAILNDACEAAYQYGLCEKRRRKLARKVKGAKE